MSLVNPSAIESLAQIEARQAINLPFIDKKGDAVTLLGDCDIKITNISSTHIELELGSRHPSEEVLKELESITEEKEEESVTLEIPEKVTHKGLNKQFEDNMTPKKLLISGTGALVTGGAMLAGGWAIKEMGEINSPDVIGNAVAIGGVGSMIGGSYNIIKGLYRWATGTTLAPEVATALDNVKTVANESAAAKFTRRV